MDQLAGFCTVRRREHQFCLAGTLYADFGIFVYITVSVTCQRDGLFPVADAGTDALYQNRCTEHGAVQNGANRAVGAFPHLL